LIKLCSIPTIALILLFQGCATERSCVSVSDYPEYEYNESEINESEIISSDYHIVESGETLASIAKDYGRKSKDIAVLNGLSSPYIVYPGQSLRIDDLDSSDSITERVSSSRLYQTSKQSQQPQKYKTTPFPTLGVSTACSENEHQVQRGENLSFIAKRYGQDYKKVAVWNHLSSPYQLKTGQCLRITPVIGQTTVSTSINQDSVSHIVLQGENLSSIAKNYGYSVSELARWNGLKPPYPLSRGQRLRVSPWPLKTQPIQGLEKKQVTQSTTSNQVIYHTVVRGDTLYSLSKRYGHPIADIVKWNRLQSPYSLSVGQGLQIGSQKGIANTPCSLNPCSQNDSTQAAFHHNTGYHTVVRGDTLYSISRRYGYPVSKIAAWNNLSPPYNLSNGQTLRVYPPSGILSTVRYKPLLTQKTALSKLSTHYHTVQRGDTVYSLSKRYGYSVEQIARWNRLIPPYNLSVGQRLQVSTKTSTQQSAKNTRSSASPSFPSSHYHIVKPGETLISVADKYGLSVYKLSKWNGIGSPYTIYPGQKISLVAP